jgi:UDP-N-acetylmuramoyl-L-alanyl-D-glutamate--2,6-diaminopimelate ligase
VPLIGTFNVYNSLAALAAAATLGVPLRHAVAALATAPAVPGRLQPVPARKQYQVFVDYAHSPDALSNVLRTLRDLRPARLITVFGCGGDRDRAKRPLMARAAEEYSDLCIATSDNPRSEDPLAILADVQKGFQEKPFEVIADRRQAIQRAVALAAPRDIVLIAGKGHETYQEIKGEKFPFDDVQVAAAAIADRLPEEATP